MPKNLVESDGDAVNNGTGFGKPAKDVSINFVPVPYPDYPPATITMQPNERQLWRVVNASAITYLNLEVLFRHTPQPLAIVALDGVPINVSGGQAPSLKQVNHIGVPPGGRVEFVMNGPPAGVPSVLAALSAKYSRPEDRPYLPDADPAFDVVYALRPRSALAWRLDDYAASQRRWFFES